MKRFCKTCKKETGHTKRKKSGFVVDCLVAAITGFGTDLREPDLECNSCGSHRDEP